MARAAEQSLITGGEKGGCVSPFFNGECALRPEKTSIIHRRRTVLGNRSVAFWTDDPYFRLRPEVANPSALSARC
jgi:hypothetical protein